MPPNSINHLVNPASGAGITLELLGYGTAITCHIKLQLLPFVECYVIVKDTECVIEELPNFTYSTDETTVYSSMLRQLHESKGDTYSYASILLTYYKRASESAKSANKAMITKQQSSLDDSMFQIISSEVSRDKIQVFADKIDDHCYQCLKRTVGFDCVRRSLLLDNDMLQFYIQFREQFPSTHRTIQSIVSSQHFNEKHDVKGLTEENTIHRKQRLILFIFLASIRCKSVFLLKYWAIIEPLGIYYKGHQQLSSKTLSGAFSMTLPTSLDALDLLYRKEMPEFAAHLERSPYLFGAFDNWQQCINIKNITEHQSALMHRGTSYILKEVKNIAIVSGSSIQSPNGLKFKITSSRPHGNNSLVQGFDYFTPNGVAQDVVEAEIELVKKGLLLPLLDWTVLHMPGFSPMPQLDFKDQQVPPPRRAWTTSDAKDSDILFGRDRKLRQPTDDAVQSLSTDRMHKLHMLSQRLTLMNIHSKHIHSSTKSDKNPYGIGSTTAETEFANLMSKASAELDRCAKFENDLIKHLNPGCKEVDKMFVFPLSPHEETSHDGMKMVFSDLGQDFQLFHVHKKKGTVTTNSHSENRKVFLCVASYLLSS